MMRCVPCLNESYLVAADMMPADEKLTVNTTDILVYQGMTMCQGHYNLVAGYPPGYPDVPITDDVRDRLAEQHPRFLQARGGHHHG